ncbi:MAG: HNH endonuclease [Candidatus Helarchaeota archaeon]
MIYIKENNFNDIAEEFSRFFKTGTLISSYKPVLLKAILYNLKMKYFKIIDKSYLILVEKIAEYFLKFYYILYKKYNLKQLKSIKKRIKVYDIIDKYYNYDSNIQIPKNPDPQIIKDIIKILFRNVIFLLRKDSGIYEFVDKYYKIIELKKDIKDEQEFKRLLRSKNMNIYTIKYIGIPEIIYHFIELNRPILNAAITANLIIFLEKLNNIPNLCQKIMCIDGDYKGIRNISDADKTKLFKYQKYRCFYCGNEVVDLMEADHFIPYNYLFDSKIWNIVGACQTCNRRKSNYMVDIKYLRLLQERNKNIKFQMIFKNIVESEWESIQKVNELLEHHYKNCSRYFNKIEL